MHNQQKQQLLPQQLETIYCDGCGVPINQSNGKFLRPVILLCGECSHRNTWHPAKKSLDKAGQKADRD